MSAHPLDRRRLYCVALVAVAEIAHLAWEYFHGGVRAHHVLARADLPSISNWWGLLVLPLLAWLAASNVQRRMTSGAADGPAASRIPASAMIGFFGALVLGGSLALAFTNRYADLAGYIFQAILLLALLLPVYRAECVLGFAMGMTLATGPVLPMMVGAVIAAFSAFIHLLLRPLLVRLWRRLRPPASAPSRPDES
jgi:hypothetical protein